MPSRLVAAWRASAGRMPPARLVEQVEAGHVSACRLRDRLDRRREVEHLEPAVDDPGLV